MLSIEARIYGPDVTEAEREALRDRVFMYTADTVCWYEIPVQSTYQIAIFGEKLAELTRSMEKFYLIIDLTEAGRPKPEVIDSIRNVMKNFTSLRHAAVCTGKNFMLNIAAKFVLERLGFASYSIHKTIEQAAESIKNEHK